MKYRSFIIGATAFVFFGLMFSACSRMSSQEVLSELRKGMTIEEVRASLGRPSKDNDLGSNKRLYAYKVDKGYIVVFFVNGKIENFNRTDKIIFR